MGLRWLEDARSFSKAQFVVPCQNVRGHGIVLCSWPSREVWRVHWAHCAAAGGFAAAHPATSHALCCLHTGAYWALLQSRFSLSYLRGDSARQPRRRQNRTMPDWRGGALVRVKPIIARMVVELLAVHGVPADLVALGTVPLQPQRVPPAIRADGIPHGGEQVRRLPSTRVVGRVVPRLRGAVHRLLAATLPAGAVAPRILTREMLSTLARDGKRAKPRKHHHLTCVNVAFFHWADGIEGCSSSGMKECPAAQRRVVAHFQIKCFRSETVGGSPSSCARSGTVASMPISSSAAKVILFGLARLTAQQIEKVSLSYSSASGQRSPPARPRTGRATAAATERRR
eukprot:COSAG04_NODE_440_length_14411_cov_40.575112_16_plen_342_part_00